MYTGGPPLAETVAWALPDLGMKIDVPRFGVAGGASIILKTNRSYMSQSMSDYTEQ